MSFNAEPWKSIQTISAAILRHPFLLGLTDGSLARESFRFYAAQEALYLREFARAQSIPAPGAPHNDWIVMFNEPAAGRRPEARTCPTGCPLARWRSMIGLRVQ